MKTVSSLFCSASFQPARQPLGVRFQGKSPSFDSGDAFSPYDSAADELYFTGEYFAKRSNDPADAAKAINFLSQAAETATGEETLPIIFEVAKIFAEGTTIVSPDAKKADRYLGVAGERYSSDPEIQFHIGKIYLEGLGTLQSNPEKGNRYLDKAALLSPEWAAKVADLRSKRVGSGPSFGAEWLKRFPWLGK